MKISVIIPVYNGEKWVEQCLSNMLAQTFKDLEIIVIDDGSTDRTAEIVAHYPVRLLTQKNAGLSVSRNRGIEEATGDYIHFMDVDDLINIDYYARMADAIDASGADIAIGGFLHEVFPESSQLFDERWLLTSKEDIFNLTGMARDCYAWRYIARKSLYMENELRFEAGRFVEDKLFTVKAVLSARGVVTVPGAVYYYKYRAGSIMRNVEPEKVRKRNEDYKHAVTLMNEMLEKRGIPLSCTRSPIDQKHDYKILGIPVLKKHTHMNGITKWYLLGVRIVRKRPILSA